MEFNRESEFWAVELYEFENILLETPVKKQSVIMTIMMAFRFTKKIIGC